MQALLADTTTATQGKVELGSESLLNDLDHPVSSSPQVQSQSQPQGQEQEQVQGRPSLDDRTSSIDDQVPSLPSTPIYNSPAPSPARARASVVQPMGNPTSTRFAMLFGRGGAGVPRGGEKGSGGPMTSAGEVSGQDPMSGSAIVQSEESKPIDAVIPSRDLDSIGAVGQSENSAVVQSGVGVDSTKPAVVDQIEDSTLAVAVVLTQEPNSTTETNSLVGESNSSGDDVPPATADASSQPVTTPADALSESQPTTSNAAEPPQQTSSWWGYLGWSSTPAMTNDASSSLSPPVIEPPQSSTPLETIPTVANDTPHPSEQAMDVEPPQDTTSPGDVAPDSSERAMDVDTQPVSDNGVVAGDSAPAPSGGSAWYSPWSWYSSAPTTTATSQMDGLGVEETSLMAEDSSAAIEVDVPHAPEGQAVEANSAPTASETTIEIPTSTSDHPPETNPIEATITTHRSGWASFFSSRAGGVKRIEYGGVKRDEHGAEVMEIDVDEVEGEEKRETGEGEKVVEGQVKGVLSMTTTSEVTINAKSTPKSTPAASKPASGTNTPILPSSPSSASPLTAVKNGMPAEKPMAAAVKLKRTASPTPSIKKSNATPPPPNLILPTWGDTFHTAPRNVVPPPPPPSHARGDNASVGGKLLGKTIKFVSGVLFANDAPVMSAKGKERERENVESLLEKERREKFVGIGRELPKAWGVLRAAGWDVDPGMGAASSAGRESLGGDVDGGLDMSDVLRGCKRVVVIGVHGWFPGTIMRTVIGEPTGTSPKFVNMTVQALQDFEDTHGVKLEKITKVPLEGDGTIDYRVDKLYTNLKANEEWMADLHAADAIFISTHSQGCVVSTHLLDRLIRDKHIRPPRDSVCVTGADSFPSSVGIDLPPDMKPQRICCLALCGIHHGPLRYLGSSTLVQPYIQYFESLAARELFEFQNTESAVSKAYIHALKNVLDHGVKILYVASLNDQVVPIYSGLFTAVTHPLILRALYIDGVAYHSSDFLSNLLVLLLRIRNSGLSDSGLLAHLSEATAGSLNGVGHSTAYEDVATYSLAVKYLFLANDGTDGRSQLDVEPFNASHEQNDYEIPWALREIIADERVVHLFSKEITELRDAFREWHPKTSILRDLKRKLQPIQKLPSTFSSLGSVSKL